ncbi:CBS domain-containing protein [Oceanobacillus kimchii]|uniref:CBS domain-containing protein n=1 Tax=Oceanobacillus kimchii TaxID=746691 RepID=UPI00232C4BF6|nr:CBS domain-containing protein [Oceanobacillus kimchii]
MYKNSERFITAFNRIDKALKSQLNKKEMGFSRAVRVLSDSNATIKRYYEDLLEFAELRNAIIHNRINVSYAIAEPHDTIVERIEKIEEDFTSPKQVKNAFIKQVVTFQLNDSMQKLLQVVRDRGLTKLPIYENQDFKGLITHKGIARWIANSMNDGQLITDATAKDILEYEKSDNHLFISEEMSVYEAADVFTEQVEKGNRLAALLITKTGKEDEKLVGIITNWDIMEI